MILLCRYCLADRTAILRLTTTRYDTRHRAKHKLGQVVFMSFRLRRNVDKMFKIACLVCVWKTRSITTRMNDAVIEQKRKKQIPIEPN